MFLWAICHPNQFPIYSIPTTYWFPVSSISLVPFPWFSFPVSLASQSSVTFILDPVSIILSPDWLYLLGFPSLFFLNLCALSNYFHNADSALISSHNCFILVVLHASVRPEGEELRPQDSCFLFFFLISSAPLVHSITLNHHGIRIQHKVAWEKLVVKLGFVSLRHGWRLKSNISLTYSMARPGQVFQMKNDSLAQSTRTFQTSAIITCLVYHMHVFFPSHLHRNSEMFLAKSFSKIQQEAAFQPRKL